MRDILAAFEGELLESYTSENVAEMLAGEYQQLVQLARCFSEKEARRTPSRRCLSALEIVSQLAGEELPYGPAPSLSDALHALDRAYAAWQAEPEAYRHWQARQLAFHSGQLVMLYLALDPESQGTDDDQA